jgi:hypothetical protein
VEESKGKIMSLNDRRTLYETVENHRQRPLIVYVTSKRSGVPASMATDALPFLIDQLDALPSDAKAVDFMIASLGGDPMVAWRIMSLLRGRVENVAVLVPQSAYSAATLVALGANEIIMHPNSHLGPVDMQISTFTEGMTRQFSTEDIGAFIEFVREQLSITDQRHLRKLFEATCREVGTLGVGFTARSSKLAVALGEKLLRMHLPDEEEKDDAAPRILVEKLSRQFHSHAYPVSRKEALEIGLPVNEEQDQELDKLIWKIWLDLEEELKERQPFSPIIELLNSASAAELLAPVPQLHLPMNAPGPSYFQADLPAIDGAKKEVQPINFEYLTALMESCRLSHVCATSGKILASRLPDLNVQFNVLTSFRGWRRT